MGNDEEPHFAGAAQMAQPRAQQASTPPGFGLKMNTSGVTK